MKNKRSKKSCIHEKTDIKIQSPLLNIIDWFS